MSGQPERERRGSAGCRAVTGVGATRQHHCRPKGSLAAAGTAAHFPLPASHHPLLTFRYPLPTLPWLMALLAVLALGGIVRADDAAAARRQRIGNMSAAEKAELRRRQERFAKLDRAEQQRLRQLHAQLDDNPELRHLMHRYCQWLKALPPYERAELLELEPAERVKRIKQLRQAEAEREANRPDRKDVEGLFRWMDDYVSEHEARIVQSLPEPVQERMAKLDPAGRRRWVAWMTWQRWQWGRPGKPPWLGEDDLAKLRSYLTDNGRKRLESQDSPEKQWQMITGWVRHAFRPRMASRRSRGPMPPELQKELDRFFEHELSPEQRDRLLSLPGDELQRELRRLYLSRRKPPDSPSRRSHRPIYGRPGRPGSPRDYPEHLQKGPRSGGPPAVSKPKTPPDRTSPGPTRR